ncbi:MAG: ATP-dependent RNA helicase [Verrucomicrobiota bacterium]|nr:ATP-dependent RNA helicase [Verrucomicrobiota bacterium]
MNPTELPIQEIRHRLETELRTHRRFVLQAPTGSGKSTQVPQMIHDAWLAARNRVVVLQPRRIAARMLARRVAQERGVQLGGEVGYQVRFEGAFGRDTKILYVTEGLLLRQMLGDPLLSGVGALIFDEFHERHLYGDISLAQAMLLQRDHRPDLLIGVMSATLETEALTRFLTPCAVLQSAGRTFPVDISYSANAVEVNDKPVWEQAGHHVNRLAKELPDGDFLVFMPGAYEIQRTLTEIRKQPLCRDMVVMPLHGELTPQQQDAAMERYPKRKVVVATNVAETSLTIDGVRIVIDSGLARIPAFDPNRGINTLLVQKISQASADQRAGRAGRTAPGKCLRLWGEREHRQRPAQELPEVRRLDLTEIVLTLLASGISDFENYPWFEAPDAKSLQRGLMLLGDLGALVPGVRKLSALGERLADFPMHPRYSRMFLAASEQGCLPTVALIAALSQGRNLLLPLSDKRKEEKRDEMLGANEAAEVSDFIMQVNAFNLLATNRFNPDFCREWGIHGVTALTAGDLYEQFMRLATAQRLNVTNEVHAWDSVGKALITGFSDQLAVRLDRGSFRCALIHGRKGELRKQTVVRNAPLVVAAEIEERDMRGDVTTLLGDITAVDESWLRELFPADFSETTRTYYDESQRRVQAVRERKFRDLILESKEGGEPNLDEAARLLTEEVIAGRLTLKQWDSSVDRLIERINFCANYCTDYGFHPFGEEEKRLMIAHLCYGAVSYKAIKEIEVLPALWDFLPASARALVDKFAPEVITLPEGSRIRLRYEQGKAIASATVQQLYDAPAQLKLAQNRAPVTFEILAPNRRPVQITSDLAAFWTNSYPEVKKQLRGRYPKHEWR